MNYIVLDMEWNQPYSKSKKQSRGVELVGEIIQLGAVKLDSHFNKCDSFERNIAPSFYKKVNRHVSDITGITTENLSGCDPFPKVLCDFLEFCGNDYKFMTWGSDDMPMLKNNMKAHGLECLRLSDNINLQLIFNAQISHEGRQWSLSDAMEKLDIEQTLQSHDALSDALNTAKIAEKLNVGRYTKSAFIENGVDTLVKEGYKTLRQLFSDKKLYALKCPICYKKLKKSDWVSGRYKKYTVSCCPTHGAFKVMLTAYRGDNGYTVSRKTVYASSEAVDSYNEKIRELAI